MPIVAWGWPFKSSEVDAAHYRLIRDCGCNHTIQWVEGLDGIRKCLDAAEEAGIRLLLHSPTVVGDPEKVIPQIKNHPALAATIWRTELPEK